LGPAPQTAGRFRAFSGLQPLAGVAFSEICVLGNTRLSYFWTLGWGGVGWWGGMINFLPRAPKLTKNAMVSEATETRYTNHGVNCWEQINFEPSNFAHFEVG